MRSTLVFKETPSGQKQLIILLAGCRAPEHRRNLSRTGLRICPPILYLSFNGALRNMALHGNSELGAVSTSLLSLQNECRLVGKRGYHEIVCGLNSGVMEQSVESTTHTNGFHLLFFPAQGSYVSGFKGLRSLSTPYVVITAIYNCQIKMR